MTLPRHIAIIPDGNRRWAKELGLPSVMGHQEGAKTIEKILARALELGIPYFTLWGCSISNLTKRDPKEVAFLYKLFETQFNKLAKAKAVHKNEVQINVLGAWREYFPASGQAAIENMIEATKNYNKFHLTFLLAYSGTDEMLRAIKNIAADPQKPIDEARLKQNLFTHDLPPVDLVIRTAGEPHLSAGFMMWDIADAQLHFSDSFWPAFSPEEFGHIIEGFGETERRFGK